MQKAAIFVGFAPWIIFAVVAGPSSWMYAALTALICSLVLAVPEWRRNHAVSVLNIAGIVFFAVLLVLALVLDRAALQPIEDRAQLISSVVIALVALGSLAVGRPFTEYYAKQTTPREYWDSPPFKRINRVLTLVWAAVFVFNALCDLLVATSGASSDLLNWVLPVVAIVAAVKFSEWYPDHVQGGSDAPSHGAHEAGRPVA